MGTSNLGYFSSVAYCFDLIDPKSMLDVGIGWGLYGFISRVTLDYGLDSNGEQMSRQVRIDGIEVFPNAIRSYHHHIYDNIYIGEASEIIKQLDYHYDMMYLGDVIEHFKKAEAIDLLSVCREKADTVFLATPYIYFDQGVCEGNEHENHLSGWDMYDFKELGAKYIFRSGIAVLAIFTDKELPFADNVNYAKAANAVERFNDKDIKNFKLLLQKYLETNQIEECCKVCEKYSEFFPDDFEVNFLYAYSNELLGRKIQAYELAKKCLQISPGNELCNELIARLML